MGHLCLLYKRLMYRNQMFLITIKVSITSVRKDSILIWITIFWILFREPFKERQDTSFNELSIMMLVHDVLIETKPI